jgi:hypothetical protein
MIPPELVTAARLPALGGQPLQRSRPAFRPRQRQDAYDEAAYLLLHALHLPLDRLEPFLDARLTAANGKPCSPCSNGASRSASRPPT